MMGAAMRYVVCVGWIAVLCLTAAPSSADDSVRVRYLGDCGKWVAARKAGGSSSWQYEAWLAGYLSGLAAGLNVEFWRAKGGTLSTEATELYVDKWCANNPLGKPWQAADKLFEEHTGRRP